MVEKSRGKLLIYGVIIILLLFGLFKIFIDRNGMFFYLEFVGFIFLLLLSLIGLMVYKHKVGEKILFFVSIFYLINLILIYFFNSMIYISLLLLSLIFFLMSIPSKCSDLNKMPIDHYQDGRFNNLNNSSLISEEKDEVGEIDMIKPKVESRILKSKNDAKKETKKLTTGKIDQSPLKIQGNDPITVKNNIIEKENVKTDTVKKTHSPGKYVASNMSNVYHEPKCSWAKKISDDRRIWFIDKQDAWEKGYKAHNCAKDK